MNSLYALETFLILVSESAPGLESTRLLSAPVVTEARRILFVYDRRVDLMAIEPDGDTTFDNSNHLDADKIFGY